MRPFLRFQRLPDRALRSVRRVLDEDDSFRRRLASTTGVEALGRASWLVVHRPDGWSAELDELIESAARSRADVDDARAIAGLTRRVNELEAALRSAESGRDSAVADLDELRGRLVEERRQRHRAESETGRLRQRVTGLEVEREELRQRLASAMRREAADDGLSTRVSVLETALDASGRRVAQLEAAEAAWSDPTRPVRIDTALEEAVAAASDALAAVVWELDLAHGRVDHLRRRDARPVARAAGASGRGTRSGRRPAALPPAVFDDSDEAASFLLRLRGVTVLVDGYNVTKLARPDMALPDQRQWLVDSAIGLAARCGADVQLVFDGAGGSAGAPADRSRRSGVQVRFSSEHVEADDVLIELVGVLPADRPVVVATNDRRVRDACRSAGANVVSSEQLLSALDVTPRP